MMPWTCLAFILKGRAGLAQFPVKSLMKTEPERDLRRRTDASFSAEPTDDLLLVRHNASANPSNPTTLEANGIEPMTSCLQSRRSPN